MAMSRVTALKATGCAREVKALARCHLAPRFIATAPALRPGGSGGPWRNTSVFTDTGEPHALAPAAPAGPAGTPPDARQLAGSARAARARGRLAGRGVRGRRGPGRRTQ